MIDDRGGYSRTTISYRILPCHGLSVKIDSHKITALSFTSIVYVREDLCDDVLVSEI